MSNINKPLPPKDDRDNLFDFAWGKVIGGLLLVGIAFWLHTVFTDLETGVRESARMNWIIVLLYKSLGHIPTIVILGVGGVVALVLGVRQIIRERQ